MLVKSVAVHFARTFLFLLSKYSSSLHWGIRMSNLANHGTEEGEITEAEENEVTKEVVKSEEGFVDGMQISEDLVECQGEPRSTWLHDALARYRIHPDLIQHCENLLIVREGFTTREVFASIPANKMTHEYLSRIGVNPLGVQGILLTVHKNLQEDISQAEMANIPAPAVKWLRSKLRAAHTVPQLQHECEWKLVVQEGITSKDLFASLPENVFNVSYLKRIGILGLGVQHLLLEFHAELHYTYIQHLNYMARAHTVVPQAVGHKRGAVRNDARDDSSAIGDGRSGGAGEVDNGDMQKHTHKRARHEDVKIDVEID